MKFKLCHRLQKNFVSGWQETNDLQQVQDTTSLFLWATSTPLLNSIWIIHPELVKKIHELVEKSFNSVRDIKLHLKERVSQMFPEPADASVPVNSAFYPDDDRIYFNIYDALFKMKCNEWMFPYRLIVFLLVFFVFFNFTSF